MELAKEVVLISADLLFGDSPGYLWSTVVVVTYAVPIGKCHIRS